MTRNNPLLRLEQLGQSLWLDYIRREMVTSGELRRLIEEDGLKGITSNPAIFEKAIAGSKDYDQAIRALAMRNKSVAEIYQTLTVEDVRWAAEVFLPLYEKLDGRDGFVSLEVNPHLARDPDGTIAEARRLWKEAERPNIFIKVPATLEGLPAVTRLISEGINVNVTLLFGLPRYEKVIDAYLAGLEERVARGASLKRVASVASFFLSRIDVLVDPLLEKILAAGGPQAKIAANLRGEVAVACAKMAYSIYQRIFGSQRFQALAAKGARPQRVLWASTSTKNPKYSDVKYVEPLIGPDTINTMPLETLHAYRDHGDPAPRLEEGLDQAARVLQHLPALGIDLNQVAQQLEDEGIEKFNKPYDSSLCTLEGKRRAVLTEMLDALILDLGEYQPAVAERLGTLEAEKFSDRLWRKDGSLWQKAPEMQQHLKSSLGWLHSPEKMEANLSCLIAFTQEMRQAGFQQVVLMGMGGSSLAPLVFQRIFSPRPFGLPLTVLDTTAPAAIREIENRRPLSETLFIVASKSGTTTEPRAFADYFYARLQELKGEGAGDNFLAITDPGSPLEKLAAERNFRGSFCNFPDVGGRYSALSFFGLLPAALMNIGVMELLGRSLRMLHACSACVPLKENPGVVLGAALGELARRGRDKVTFLMPPVLASLGMWLEQLLAESTGKEGTGLLPVAGEPVGDPSVYGDDRVFIYFRLQGEGEKNLEDRVKALKRAGQPVITIQLADHHDIAQEFYRWEIATATAGAILGINPFDQPNVQESKDNTKRLLQEVREQGRLPQEKASLKEGPLSLYGQEGATTIKESLARFFGQARPGEYLALLAYLPENEASTQVLAEVRLRLRDTLRLATTLGYGPRYLHSTGQFHKGGPNSGLFMILTASDRDDPPVPGQPYTFGVFQQAQAIGDMESLQRHGRRVVRLHLGDVLPLGLTAFMEVVEKALAQPG
jgi:transaldolase/glucose-6-phosphate isomerase